jgi:hypothetical protein
MVKEVFSREEKDGFKGGKNQASKNEHMSKENRRFEDILYL